MKASASLSNIPNDIIRHILLLPVKFVIRCQCVCKQWRSLIQDSDFKLSYPGQGGRVIILSYESKSSKNSNHRFFVRSTSHDLRLQRHKWPFGEGYPLVRASSRNRVTLCSCNGLVFLVAERNLLLWNPSTSCSTKVLEWPYPNETKTVFFTGLCYDSCTIDYKAVLLLSRSSFGHALVISASLTHKEWRPVEFNYSFESIRSGVNFRNTFHWWVVSGITGRGWGFLPGNKIIYFDPVCDEFRILPTPELRHEREKSIVGLGVIDDCFCMTCNVQEEEPETIQVLIMKEYGRQESWMTAFAIQMPDTAYGWYDFTLTFYSQKETAQEVLFLSTGSGWPMQQVYVYDRKKNELKEVLKDFLTSNRRHIVSMCFYVESLACPGDYGLLSQ